MLDLYKRLTISQFEAALCTLSICIERCPESHWNTKVGNLAFCQVAFHTLFFADVYLGLNAQALKEQPFHRDNPGFFRDYEELEDRAQTLLYDKPDIQKYIGHCREKLLKVLGAETAESLTEPAQFGRRAISRAELYIYNMRHIQHHAAQLSLRLRLDLKDDVPWIGSGWREI